ncbi:MAG TPA: hypothetical protein VJ908_09760 [Wenzhouxiangellaceae bacterium]|nr:hypothetical protein [Wenzhouxiangellaceae bacterium]
MKIMLFRIAMFSAYFLCQPAAAGPVGLSADHQGQALILPLWTVEAGNDSLITVRNNSLLPVAVKVRIIDGDGFELLAFNLYLNDDDSWTGAMSAAGGGAELISTDESCVLPRFDADASGVTRVGLPVSMRRSGYIEIVEMGYHDVGLVGGPRVQWSTCSDLAERFETGDWATDPDSDLGRPQGVTSAGVRIIDVADGGMVSVPTTALDGFSDIVQHSAPDRPVPNLSTAHAPAAALDATESRLCGSHGCRVLSWELPVEAVASVLAAPRLRGGVTVNPAIGAQTELVITRPLKRYESDSGFALGADVGLALYDREGRFVEPDLQTVQLSPPPPPKATPIDLPALQTDDAVVAIAFDQHGGDGQAFTSSLLGLPGESLSLDGTGFVAGHAEIRFNEFPESRLISLEGQSVRGEAAIGIVVLQFSNGTLEADPATQVSVLSNYRTAEAMTRR